MERERRSPKRTKRRSRQEILGRYVLIEAAKQSVGLRTDRPRGQPPALATSASVELRGRLSEPVANVTEARITVFPDPAADVSPSTPPAIGAIIGIKSCLQVVVHYPVAEFNQLWTLVATLQVRSAYVAFTAPFRGSSLVVTLDFSSVLDPEDDSW